MLDSVIRDCQLNLDNHLFPIDLTPMQLGSFDIIVGMDWLTKHHAEVVCFDKIVRIPLPTIMSKLPSCIGVRSIGKRWLSRFN